MQYKSFEVEVLRGSQVESRHEVIAAIVSESFAKEVYGEGQLSIFPRSSLKPIQALPLLVSGAAKHFQLSSKEIALACASHRGEAFHIEVVKNWLGKIGLSEDYLECGTHAPSHQESLYQLLRAQQQPSAIHNNCSGKHTGMLTTAVHRGEPTKNYVSLNHPVQRRIWEMIAKLCQVELKATSFGIDGCSIPAPSLPLIQLAKGFCELANPIHLSSEMADACRAIFSAFVENPLLTAGTGTYCSEMMLETKGQVLLKGGAEGVMVAAIPALQMGIALKCLDGHSRATEFCTSVLLNSFGLLANNCQFLTPTIRNWNGIETGILRLKHQISSF